jgi:hypothetical protein
MRSASPPTAKILGSVQRRESVTSFCKESERERERARDCYSKDILAKINSTHWEACAAAGETECCRKTLTECMWLCYMHLSAPRVRNWSAFWCLTQNQRWFITHRFFRFIWNVFHQTSTPCINAYLCGIQESPADVFKVFALFMIITAMEEHLEK